MSVSTDDVNSTHTSTVLYVLNHTVCSHSQAYINNQIIMRCTTPSAAVMITHILKKAHTYVWGACELDATTSLAALAPSAFERKQYTWFAHASDY